MRLKNRVKMFTEGFNPDKYWRRRFAIYDANVPGILKAYYKQYCRRVERKQGAWIGFSTSDGKCNFASPPRLGHNLYGIIIAGSAQIGRNCLLEPQITIGVSQGRGPVLGDNVFVGTGARIIGPVKIGNNVRIGANCIVVTDIPDNATVVMEKPRIIIKEANYQYHVSAEDM